ncbi:MAG: response regulator transcription factor [Oscillospiraceae bacterium]|nr:response regulator transcription factor [Oscillospiraceae bacterium]
MAACTLFSAKGAFAVYRILIADDEPDIVAMLKDYFEMNGYEIITALNGREAISQSGKNPDIILLDVNMPDADGLTVCRTVREYVSCPIIFLTARIEDSDKIAGFAAGGDDYVIKPFSIDELGARVAAHIRRDRRSSSDSVVNVRFFGSLAVDYSAKTVTAGGKPLEFPKKEFEIIELLSMNAGQVFDKERIYERIWGYDAEGDSSVVAEHIRRIRTKLAAVNESRIETVWGMGYKWIK